MSSAVCLIGIILFSATGITLNHAGAIETDPVIVSREGVLPSSLVAQLQRGTAASDAPVPGAVADWLESEYDVALERRTPEWSDDELYIALPRAGGDGWIAIDRLSGDITYEDTDRGLIAYFNDLHKGRDTGTAWAWFIDIFAAACIIFSLTGFLLLQVHSRKRPSTWPLVGAGVIVPALLLIFLAH